MGEVEIYTATIGNWRESKSYLFLKKNIIQMSNGSTFERYEVIKRWNFQGDRKDPILTDSMKGIEFNKSELINLRLCKGKTL